MLIIRILIASDIRLYRQGLERVLREFAEFAVIGTAASAAEAIEQTQVLDPDVVLLDMAMSGAFAVVKEVARGGRRPGKIVALGVPDGGPQVVSCAQVGIAGHVVRDGSVEDVVETIKAAARGEVRCSPKTAGPLFMHVAATSRERSLRTGNGVLTVREAQILKLVQEGMSNRQISRTVGIELPTVKNHVHSILVKLGIRRRAEAISLLYRSNSEKGAAVGGC